VRGSAGRAAGAALLALLGLVDVPSVLAGELEIVPPASRDVTPPGFTPGPGGSGPLVREPVPPPPPDAPRWHRFVLPMTTDAATFLAEDREVTVAGVVAPPRTETCPMADGEAWPCGKIALSSLRRFLLGRPVECWFGPSDTGRKLSVACRVGKTDIGLWLLAQGWAKPATDASDAYRQAADAARCAQRGLWRNGERDRRSQCPVTQPQAN
jgi:endonuclease YncB( thermonuclease family)